jgi:hypothetical protein
MAVQSVQTERAAANAAAPEPTYQPTVATAALRKCDINGVTPFGFEPATQVLNHTYALVTVLSAAFRDAEIITNAENRIGQESGLSSMRDEVKAQALEAVGDLIALAHTFVEGI